MNKWNKIKIKFCSEIHGFAGFCLVLEAISFQFGLNQNTDFILDATYNTLKQFQKNYVITIYTRIKKIL